MLDLRTSASLLTIVARKLGHDIVLLRSDLMSSSFTSKEKWFKAIFGHHENYDIELLETNSRRVWLKNVDAEGNLRSTGDMYVELVELLYKILENGGNVSDGRKKLVADDVPGFMINCVLNGYA